MSEGGDTFVEPSHVSAFLEALARLQFHDDQVHGMLQAVAAALSKRLADMQMARAGSRDAGYSERSAGEVCVETKQLSYNLEDSLQVSRDSELAGSPSAGRADIEKRDTDQLENATHVTSMQVAGNSDSQAASKCESFGPHAHDTPSWYQPEVLVNVLEGYAALGFTPGAALLFTCASCLLDDLPSLSQTQCSRLLKLCRIFQMQATSEFEAALARKSSP